MTHCILIGAPVDQGQKRPGCLMGPAAYRVAGLGATLTAPTHDGEAEVEIPAGTQPGEVVVLRGRGMPSLRGGRRGALRVVVNVVIPRRLSREQRDLLETLSGTITEENLRSDEGLVSKLRRVLGG